MPTEPSTRAKNFRRSTRPDCDDYIVRYSKIRDRTEQIASQLSAEDQQVQSMPDVSPTKWHLAHITWFFETFILKAHAPGCAEFDPDFNFLFNSYYEAVGPRHARPDRGLLDGAESEQDRLPKNLRYLLELGLHHEQQHQELILMDIKHVLCCNTIVPAYRKKEPAGGRDTHALEWFDMPGGAYRIGH